MLKFVLVLGLICACLCSFTYAIDAFPRVSGETLAGKPIVLPDAVKRKPTLLILSFSRSAEEQTKAWADKLNQNKVTVDRFQVLELEDVPRLFRGFVKGGIKREIRAELQGSFVLLFDEQDALKRVTNFQKDYEAYVLLLDAGGNIQWREHGAVSDQKMADLAKKLTKK